MKNRLRPFAEKNTALIWFTTVISNLLDIFSNIYLNKTYISNDAFFTTSLSQATAIK